MKRFFLPWLIGFTALIRPMPGSSAQDQTESATAVAARQDAEERYQRLSAAIQELQAANAGLQKKINFLSDELEKVHEETIRSRASFVTREELNRFSEKIREVDQKREADNKRILETLENLAKMPVPAAPVSKNESARPSKPKAEKSAPAQTEKGYWYEVKKDDKLSLIVLACRKKGINVTMQQVKEANPDLNPNKVLVGQKIFIPDSSQK